MGDIQDALARYRQYYDATMPDIEMLRAVLSNMEAPLKELEGCLKSFVIDGEATVEGHGIKVTYRKGYTRHKWNDKGLQGYAVANPDILAFHSETNVKPSVAFKVA